MSSSDVQKADADLWLAYGVKLKNTLAQSSGSGANDRFYIAPLSSAGIAAGKRIDDAIKNNGVYGVGDTLLDLDQPVFLPSRQSYFQRCQSYCGSVALHSDGNTGAAVRYNDAQTKQKRALKHFQDAKKAAMANYNEEKQAGLTNDPFASWVVQNYPQYAQAQSANDSATAACSMAAAAMDGPQAAMVGKYMSALNSADGLVTIPGLNMSCSPASADQISAGQAGTPGASYQRPSYEINAQYAQTVDGWINTYAQNKPNPTTLNFKLSDSSSSSWTDLGFSSSSVQVTGSYCIFFSATFTENNTTVTKNLSAAECGSDLEVTITTTGFNTFDIRPGKWNPGELLGMPIVENADPNLKKPMASVNKALLAYGVGLQVKLSAEASSTISNYLEKARSTSGSASIFGFNIGLGGSASSTQTSTTTFDQVKNASTGTTISIPPADNAYPTLLAVFGQAIPVPGSVSN